MRKMTKREVLEAVAKIPEGVWMVYGDFVLLPREVREHLEYTRTCVFSAAPELSSGGRYTLDRFNNFKRSMGSRTITEWMLLPEIKA